MVALFLRPDADQSDGSWLNEAASATNLFNSVDEPTTPSDTDYIVSSTTDGDKVRLRLSDPSGGVTAPLIVRYRCKRTGTQAANLIGRLYQGTAPGTLRATFTQLSVPDTFTTYTYTLTSGEFASITDFTDLYVEFELSQQSSLKVDLNFAGGVYYDSGTVTDATGVLSCTRASTGFAKTVAGSLTSFATNTLRITDLGMLVEDARTNQVTRSQKFDAGGWTSSDATINIDVIAAPDGTTTGNKQVTAATTNAHVTASPTALDTTGQQAYSIFLKAAEYNYGCLSAIEGANRYTILVNLTTGAIETTNTIGSPSVTSSGVEAFTSGWWRLKIVLNVSLTGQSIQFSASDVNNPSFGGASGAPVFTGDGTSGIYAWGAQVEPGNPVSTYIANVSAGVTNTRAADSVTTSGSLQTVINAATASLVAQVNDGKISGVSANIVDSNGTNLLGFNSSNNALASITATLATSNTANRTTQDKLGTAWSGAGRSLVLNGGTVATDATAQTPSSTQHIGSSGSANFAYAYIGRLTAFNAKLADATLQGFTV